MVLCRQNEMSHDKFLNSDQDQRYVFTVVINPVVPSPRTSYAILLYMLEPA